MSLCQMQFLPQLCVALSFVVLLVYVAPAHCTRRRRMRSALPDLDSAEILSDYVNLPEAEGEIELKQSQNFTVLSFITPWNAGGSELADKAARLKKLHIASPVSYAVTPKAPFIEGDISYASQLLSSGARIYPRIHFEPGKWNQEDFEKLHANATFREQFIGGIANKFQEFSNSTSMSGVTLELWWALSASGILSSRSKAVRLLRDLATSFHKMHSLRSIFVLPPIPSEFSLSDAEILRSHFDYFILPAYDFSTPGSAEPGPVAPLWWVTALTQHFTSDCKLNKKLLLGLNFYGVNYASRSGTIRGKRRVQGEDRHVVGGEYIEILKKHEPGLNWIGDGVIAEHAFMYHDGREERMLYYPSRKSLRERIDMAREKGCGGVAIWEMGQGLPHFLKEL